MSISMFFNVSSSFFTFTNHDNNIRRINCVSLTLSWNNENNVMRIFSRLQMMFVHDEWKSLTFCVRMMILKQSKRRKKHFFEDVNSMYIYEELLFFYRSNLFFLFLCVSSLFHHLVIDLRDHNRFCWEINKIVKSSIWWWDCVF
jgi:hypothetical protein